MLDNGKSEDIYTNTNLGKIQIERKRKNSKTWMWYQKNEEGKRKSRRKIEKDENINECMHV